MNDISNSEIMKALFVTHISDSGIPYAELIINGEKTWEIRKSNTQVRGRIGILDKDARLVGTVEIVDVLGPFTAEELAKHSEHKSNLGRLKNYSKGNPLYAWVLANAKKISEPKKVNANDTGTFVEIEE